MSQDKSTNGRIADKFFGLKYKEEKNVLSVEIISLKCYLYAVLL